MKEERTIKELLQLMLEHQELFESGLCNWKNELCFKSLMTIDEYVSLGFFIAKNRPSKYSSISAYKNRHFAHYWKSGDIKPRIKWIKKHIERL
jgi:hypothetical protein